MKFDGFFVIGAVLLIILWSICDKVAISIALTQAAIDWKTYQQKVDALELDNKRLSKEIESLNSNKSSNSV